MTYYWDMLKPEVCDLYYTQKFSLKEVSAFIERKYDLKISVRSYRVKLKEWGCRKKDQKARRIRLQPTVPTPAALFEPTQGILLSEAPIYAADNGFGALTATASHNNSGSSRDPTGSATADTNNPEGLGAYANPAEMGQPFFGQQGPGGHADEQISNTGSAIPRGHDSGYYSSTTPETPGIGSVLDSSDVTHQILGTRPAFR